MRIIRILAFGLLLPAQLCLAQTAEQLERADELLAEFQESNDIPGLTFSVGKEGLIVFSEGYGFADLEHRVPVYPSITKFRVGSVAKPMTSVAIGLLVESGQLDLDAPVQQYVASFPVKEMIATLVSGQNRCPYCMHSHAFFLSAQGAANDAVAAIGRGEIDRAPITDAEKALLRFAKKLTHESHRNTPADVQLLRDAGWSEPQIAEAVYITAMFALFNRVANAFGLEDPRYYEMKAQPDPLEGVLPRVGEAKA